MSIGNILLLLLLINHWLDENFITVQSFQELQNLGTRIFFFVNYNKLSVASNPEVFVKIEEFLGSNESAAKYCLT